MNKMADRYLHINQAVTRLCGDYIVHGGLIVALDFDNTIYDYHEIGDTYPKLIALMQWIKEKTDFKILLFTAREEQMLTDAIDYCIAHGFKPDYINDSPVLNTRKPFYNILLDDRAGLQEAYEILLLTINIVCDEQFISE